MEKRNLSLVLLGVAILCAAIYMLIPSSAGIHGQLYQVGMMIVFVIQLVFWIAEALALFLGPWVWAFIVAGAVLPFIDWKFEPDKKMDGGTYFVLNVAFSILAFFLWLLVPIIMTGLPPVSNFLIGPWIAGHMETNLYWWGIYAAFVQLLINWAVREVGKQVEKSNKS